MGDEKPFITKPRMPYIPTDLYSEMCNKEEKFP
jgi:hypothetical protein